ncbi:MAG: hypothetical protein SWH78_16880 [Thermodesulfobacteriota bacterium]|nr:hypothetical protein [Thermodesulfobacteriota bacterium]
MIFKTNKERNDAQAKTLLYAPFDPKYLYPQNGYQDNGDTLLGNNSNVGGVYGLEELMNQRRDIISFKARLLFSEMYQRYKLRDKNLYRISLDQCVCTNLIYELGDLIDNRRLQLERQLIGLEQEKRKEMANYFRDVSFLRKELRETLIEKLEEDQKAAMLMNQAEEFA